MRIKLFIPLKTKKIKICESLIFRWLRPKLAHWIRPEHSYSAQKYRPGSNGRDGPSTERPLGWAGGSCTRHRVKNGLSEQSLGLVVETGGVTSVVPNASCCTRHAKFCLESYTVLVLAQLFLAFQATISHIWTDTFVIWVPVHVQCSFIAQ